MYFQYVFPDLNIHDSGKTLLNVIYEYEFTVKMCVNMFHEECF